MTKFSHRYPDDLGDLAEKNYPFIELQIVKFRDRNLIKDTKDSSGSLAPTTQYDGIGKTEVLGHIYLPLPSDVSNSYSPSWDMTGLQIIETARDVLQANGGAEKAKIIGSGAGAVVMNDIQKNFISRTANPKKQATFNGIDPRNFSFNWTLTPQDEKEAKKIESIIKTLTENALPDLKTVTDSFFDFPAEFGIIFHNVKGFPKLSYCVCTGINTNYSAGTMQLLKSGHVVQIGLSMNFMETELKTKGKPGI